MTKAANTALELLSNASPESAVERYRILAKAPGSSEFLPFNALLGEIAEPVENATEIRAKKISGALKILRDGEKHNGWTFKAEPIY